jgi:hypothetical protein
MTTPPTTPKRAFHLSGKHVLLALLGALLLFVIALYWVIIPMHFGGKERIKIPGESEVQQAQPAQP